MLQLSEEHLTALLEAIVTVDNLPDTLTAELSEMVAARYGGQIPNDVDLDLHIQVAKALGASVVREPMGWYYVDERGHRDKIACRSEQAAWWMSAEDWTRRIDDADLLFRGAYKRGLDVDPFTLWHIEQQNLDAAGRCRLFLDYIANQKETSDETET
jgi:hypothetical protein